jgi:hypothetical protein
MSSNLPATRTEPIDPGEGTPLPPSRPVSVAFLPLALVAFIVLAFVIAAWTFLAAGS